ncbi:TonB-dependent receptor [Robertkochia aurantiaca]|uniref:TonB-dependent receptor n=1 Tax=Robertkochia aurantiaca TaxID=2873700 RepID=UPI001CCC022E|nr:carboxypeptidase-like regulatory domain-containing protein [Robertkochia sp. 3YJGBD-33]
MRSLLLLSGILILLVFQKASSQSATLKGVILDKNNDPIEDVAISTGNSGTRSDQNGFYLLRLPAAKKSTVTFSHISFRTVTLTLQPSVNETVEFNPVLSEEIEQIGEIVLTSDRQLNVRGITALSPETIRKIPGANAGVENLLKTLPGVNSNNELSTQYAVRGGNYDENLVYVNDIEVYRPFLVRTGQQEGLSFINTDLISNVRFSAGGFQARYGDKLSSVLDVTYSEPVSFSAGVQASFLGASAFMETANKSRRLLTVSGIRYRDNSLLVNSRQTEANFRPRFIDAQSFVTYKLTSKFHLNLLGHYSLNDYNFQPLSRQTNFGTLQDPIALQVFYRGEEEDRYETATGALKGTWFVNDDLNLKFISSVYHATEQEFFDILAQYRLGEVNTDIGNENFGNVSFSEGIGAQLNHARNLLDAMIINLEHLGNLKDGEQVWSWGVKFTHEDIRDRLEEYEVIDSAGFSIRPPEPAFVNDQPYSPYTAPIEPFQNIQTRNKVTTNRLSAFAQWSRSYSWNENQLWTNAGVRSQWWNVSTDANGSERHFIFSPRAQVALKPNWERDMLFRLAGGLYQQPPLYRELRDSSGIARPGVKAQKSWHLIAGHEYGFKLWDRPFKLISEMFYKGLDDLNPYTLENVRIRYRARNNAEGYAYGFESRLYGELIPTTSSWVSFGYLKTEENIDDRGYISRPTDQRLKFAVLLQDYVPSIPSLKLYLNGVYNTGLPGGSPSYADPYDFQFRLPDYKRVDLGISYVFTDNMQPRPPGHWLHKFDELSVGFDIFNIFDIRNAITNTWVRDVYTKRQYAIPNYMTERVFNLKMSARF